VPVDLHLWDRASTDGLVPEIVGPVSPTEAGLDPLTLL
jgi:hypothetical protein